MELNSSQIRELILDEHVGLRDEMEDIASFLADVAAERAEVALIVGTGAQTGQPPGPAAGGKADRWQALVWQAAWGVAARPGSCAPRLRRGRSRALLVGCASPAREAGDRNGG